MNRASHWLTCEHPPLFYDEEQNICVGCGQLPGQLDALDHLN